MGSMKDTLIPVNWDYGTWRKFFLIAALWNFSGAIPAIFSPALNMRLFYGVQTDNYYILFLDMVFWEAVSIFGVGYLMVAHNPGRNHGIVIMGIIGKTVVAANWYYLFGADRATMVAFLAATGDILFTFYFIYFLIRRPVTQN